MSVKVINGKELYSLETVAEKFLFVENRREARDFIFFLQKQGLIKKDVVKYEGVKCRTYYYYHPSEWFGELINGHWYAKEQVLKGVKTNGTLYFDAFAGKALARFAMIAIDKKKKNVTTLMSNALLSVALDDYVEKIQ